MQLLGLHNAKLMLCIWMLLEKKKTMQCAISLQFRTICLRLCPESSRLSGDGTSHKCRHKCVYRSCKYNTNQLETRRSQADRIVTIPCRIFTKHSILAVSRRSSSLEAFFCCTVLAPVRVSQQHDPVSLQWVYWCIWMLPRVFTSWYLSMVSSCSFVVLIHRWSHSM